MYSASIEYCIDGYNTVVAKVNSLPEQLHRIHDETADIFSAPFSVDVVIEKIGTMSIGLVRK